MGCSTQQVTGLLPPQTDEHGNVWYPVRHLLGGIVNSLTPESQRIWQDLADKQMATLSDLAARNQ